MSILSSRPLGSSLRGLFLWIPSRQRATGIGNVVRVPLLVTTSVLQSAYSRLGPGVGALGPIFCLEALSSWRRVAAPVPYLLSKPRASVNGNPPGLFSMVGQGRRLG